MLKTGSSDPADFAMTRHLIPWRALAILAKFGVTIDISQLSQRDMLIDLKPGHSKIHPTLPAVVYQAKSRGISRCDSSDMPTVTPTIVRIATVGKLEAEPQIPLDLENQFLHRWSGTNRLSL
jgi:hypothetical protein